MVKRQRAVDDGLARDCWAHCSACGSDFRLGCSVPCPIAVYVAALKAAQCPQCIERKALKAYSPGLTPKEARAQQGFAFRL